MAEFRTFIGTYRFEGQDWAFEIRARSHAEAQARVRQLGLGRIEGGLVARVPVVGPIARMLMALKRAFGS